MSPLWSAILAFSILIALVNGIAIVSFGDEVTLTVGPPQIISVSPLENAIDVPFDATIEVSFSEPMNHTLTQDAFSIFPVISGNFSWMGDKMIFTPLDLLSEGISYTVEISASATDLDNETLDGDKDGNSEGSPVDDHSWEFTTMAESPKVESHFPVQQAIKVFTDTSVIFNFSTGMDTHATLDALSYDLDSVNFPASTNGQVTWGSSDTKLTFVPFGSFQNNKTYTFIINHSAIDKTGAPFDGDGDGIGGEGSEDDFKLTFTTIPLPPKVNTISPRKQEMQVEVDSIISLKFSKAMDKDSVEDAFSFTYEGTNTSWYASNCNVTWPSDLKVEFEPTFDLVYEKLYTVTLAATAMDTAGITLDGNKNKKPEGGGTDSFSWSFTTITQPPEIISVEPAKGTQNVQLDADIVINFDRSMDTKSTEDAFSYSAEGVLEEYDASSGIVIWTNNDRTMTFTPEGEYEEGKTHTVTIDETAEDVNGIKFLGYSWLFSTKINSEPVLEGGGVHPEKGDSSETFKFSIIYTDDDDDEPVEILVVIDEVEWRMYESDPSEDSFVHGKAYEYSIDLEAGTYKYYFTVENEKHFVRYPDGDVTRTLKVTEVEKELVFGVFEEEIAGLPTIPCLPIGIVVLIILIVVVAVVSKKRRSQAQGVAFQTFEAQGPTMDFLPDVSGELMSFEPDLEDDLMSFQAFEDETPARAAQPVMIQCPECQRNLKVRASVRPFQFPCQCGAKLVLR